MRILVPSLLLVGCAPTLLEIPAPLAATADRPPPDDGPSVTLAYPVDVRPAGERRDGGYYDSTFPLPFVTYGDANLRPAPPELVDRALHAALADAAIPEGPDGDYVVRVFVLHHVGVRDISDAQWVS